MEDINKRFNKNVYKIYDDIEPLNVSILIYYFDAFDGELNFPLREKDP
jgi:hypothetical protein